MLVLKSKVIGGMVDEHERLIEENDLHVDGVRGPNLVRVEISPPDGRLDTPLAEWVYRLDEEKMEGLGLLPEWYDAKKAEARVRRELPKWLAARVALAGESKEIREGVMYAYGSSTVGAYGSSVVCAYDSSEVCAYDSSVVWAYDSSVVRACQSHATVRHYNKQTTKPEGPKAVMIDCTGKRAVCTVEE